ncbi:hypothetical protein ACWDOP_30870 [Nocardia sp. NPDC003693]
MELIFLFMAATVFAGLLAPLRPCHGAHHRRPLTVADIEARLAAEFEGGRATW